MTPSPLRKIIHIDMDAFYASVEQRDFPEFRGKPIVVGGRPDSRGVVATASYEARAFGIHSAMPCSKAFKLCPQAIFVYPRFAEYALVSKNIREIFYRYTNLVEPLSLDEAYLDITEDKLNIGSAIEIAQQVQKSIQEELQLTASAGISINKFVAKIASGMNKPNGLTFIGASKIIRFMEQLPVEKFHGVGRVTAQKMRAMQLYTGADLKKLNEQQMSHHFGKAGRFYYNIVRGIDERPVVPNRETKSVSAEDTFPEDTNDLFLLRGLLKQLCEIVAGRLTKYHLAGKTITLKIKFNDFKIQTRSTTVAAPVDNSTEIFQKIAQLLSGSETGLKKIRLLGVTVSNFKSPASAEPENHGQLQMDLFANKPPKGS